MTSRREQDRQQEFAALLHAHQGIVRRVAGLWASGPEERSDLFQEIALQLWRSFASFRGEASFATWAWRVALNTAILRRRRAGRRPRHETSDVAAVAAPAAPVEGDDVQLLYSCIRELPELDRAIVLLHLEGRPHAEIGAITGLSTGAIDVRIHRIRRTLKERLLARGYGREEQ